MTRNGKIARLQRPLRDELNRRLAHNEDGGAILDWLNAVPEVKDLLTRDFAGEPISKQNLQMEQMPFYREEKQRAEAAESARKQSEAGARAYDERLAQRRREAEAAQMLASATSAPVAIAAASLAHAADRTAPAGIQPSVQPQFGSNQVKPIP
jgi:hypothetical protein